MLQNLSKFPCKGIPGVVALLASLHSIQPAQAIYQGEPYNPRNPRIGFLVQAVWWSPGYLLPIYSSGPNASRYCVGTLLNDRVILTAAHCAANDPGHFCLNDGVDANNPDEWYGDSPKPNTCQRVLHTAIHPHYGKGPAYDLALIETTPFTNVSSAPIELSEALPALGSPLKLISIHHDTRDEHAQPYWQMQNWTHATINKYSHYSDHHTYEKSYDIDLEHDGCAGDSGSPLFAADGSIVGVFVADRTWFKTDTCGKWNLNFFASSVYFNKDWLKACKASLMLGSLDGCKNSGSIEDGYNNNRNDTAKAEVVVYPNPAQRGAPVQVKTHLSDNCEHAALWVSDAKGVRIKQFFDQPMVQGSSTRTLSGSDLSSLAAGLYYMTFEIRGCGVARNTQGTQTFKFIVN